MSASTYSYDWDTRVNKLEGKLALLRTWEEARARSGEKDIEYMQQLRAEIAHLRKTVVL